MASDLLKPTNIELIKSFSQSEVELPTTAGSVGNPPKSNI